MSTQKQLRYLSLFSGIGGFELGIQRAYDNQPPHSSEETRPSESDENMRQVRQRKAVQELPRSSGGKRSIDSPVLLHTRGRTAPLCVGYSEIDQYAIKVYERKFNGHTNYGDATKIDTKRLPDFDLLVGGFPCQAFSVAGKRAGFDDTRGTLFFDIARILADKRPRHLVLENVKGLLSHDGGKTFTHILEVLTDLGYCVEWQVLNSKNFGVPQNRERVYIIGHLGVECGREVFPIGSYNSKGLKELTQRTNEASRVYDTTGISRTIKDGGGMGAKTGLYGIDMTLRYPEKHSKPRDVLGTIDANYYKGIANQERPAVKDNARIRRLTPKECERLQGFPDDWTKYGKTTTHEDNHCDTCSCTVDEPISDTQRYKMCGNAVTVNVVQAVMERLCSE